MLRLNGQSTAKIAATVISANTNHSVIKRFPGGTAPSNMRRCAALHHWRQARQLTITGSERTRKTAKSSGKRPSGPLSVAVGFALGGFALAGDGVFGRPAHQRRIIMPEQHLAEADRRLDLH